MDIHKLLSDGENIINKYLRDFPKLKKGNRIYSQDGTITYTTYTKWRNRVKVFIEKNDPDNKQKVNILFNALEANFDQDHLSEILAILSDNLDKLKDQENDSSNEQENPGNDEDKSANEDTKQNEENESIENISSSPDVKNNNLSSWIKSILQVILALATIVGVYYAYKTYQDNKPAHINLSFNYLDKSISIKNKGTFVSLLCQNDGSLLLGLDDEIMHRAIGCPFPVIENNSNKSITNLRVDVNISLFGGFRFDERDINQQFEISKINRHSDVIDIQCHNKYDVLHAKSSISSPINMVYLPDSIESSNDVLLMTFSFNITYDGILEDNGIVYSVLLLTSFKDKSILSDKTIENFLYNVNNDALFTIRPEGSLFITIRDRENFIICSTLEESDNSDDFNKYKSDIIDRYRSSIKKEHIGRTVSHI